MWTGKGTPAQTTLCSICTNVVHKWYLRYFGLQKESGLSRWCSCWQDGTNPSHYDRLPWRSCGGDNVQESTTSSRGIVCVGILSGPCSGDSPEGAYLQKIRTCSTSLSAAGWSSHYYPSSHLFALQGSQLILSCHWHQHPRHPGNMCAARWRAEEDR